jgi:hypothetical protein
LDALRHTNVGLLSDLIAQLWDPRMMVHLSRVLALGGLFALPAYGTVTIRTTPKLLGVDWGQWAALNASVGGRLQFSKPFGFPCFSSFEGQPVLSDPEACATVQANYSDPVSRSKLFEAYMDVSTVSLLHCLCVYPYMYQPQWETCQTTGSGCLLDDSDPTNPAAYQGRDCEIGNIAPIHVHKH